MTDTDKIYLALTETFKKYGLEHTIHGFKEYITHYNDGYITKGKDARKLINEVHPYRVVADIFRTTLKYEIIENKKGYAKVMPNEQSMMHAIYNYQNGRKVTVSLNFNTLDELMRRMIKNNVEDALNILSDNPKILDDYLSLYFNLVTRNRTDLNNIPNEYFSFINQYFDNMLVKKNQR